MSKSDVIGWACLALIVGVFLGAAFEYHRFRNKAVKSGHAEYYLDENNARQWRWKSER